MPLQNPTTFRDVPSELKEYILDIENVHYAYYNKIFAENFIIPSFCAFYAVQAVC